MSLNELNSLSSDLDVTEERSAFSLAWADWVFCNTYPIDWGAAVYFSATTSSDFSVVSTGGVVDYVVVGATFWASSFINSWFGLIH